MNATATYRLLVPLVGPDPNTSEWHEARPQRIYASEAAEACGISEYGQPLNVYMLKRGLVSPFEGNDRTDRGKRFEPFIAAEYAKRMEVEVETGLPMYFHPTVPYMGATPDGRRKDDPMHGVEFKACNWRRAANLGEEGSDQIFDDWLCQTQQQMAVMGWHTCDVFVMVDLHTYKPFQVERNDTLISRMIEIEGELWDRIQRGDPPPPDFKHPLALELVKVIYGTAQGPPIDLSHEAVEAWLEVQRLNVEIKDRETQRDELKARILYEMGEAAAARMPLGQKELVRSLVKDSLWTEDDARKAMASVGQVKRKGYVQLRERKVKT